MSIASSDDKVPETDPDFYFRTAVGNEGDVSWNHLLAPAPIGIANLSQLRVCASRVKDFEIDQKPGPLIRNPKSFCDSLAQICDDAHVAFNIAHVNMEQISFQMGLVPTHIRECVKVLKSGNKVALKKLLTTRLSLIQQAADEGLKLSREIAEEFDQLMKLIGQVLEASSAKQGAKVKELETAIQTAIEVKKERQLEMKEMEKKRLSDEMAERLMATSLLGIGMGFSIPAVVFIAIFSPETGRKTVHAAIQMVNETKRRLEVITKQLEKVEKDKKKINDQYIDNLKKMDIYVKKEIDRNEAIRLLQQGSKNLSSLQESWTGITKSFQSIHDVMEATAKKLIDFKEDATDAANDPSIIEFMATSIMQLCQSSYLMHRIANKYVQVSERYIMNNVDSMQQLMAIKDKEAVDEAQKKLMASCQEASDGILQMVMEDKTELKQEIEKEKKNLEYEIKLLENGQPDLK